MKDAKGENPASSEISETSLAPLKMQLVVSQEEVSDKAGASST